MKCQSLFSRKNKKNIINLSSAEYAWRLLMYLKFCNAEELLKRSTW